jgi:diguanylate cyclase (GGDEF)-like protein
MGDVARETSGTMTALIVQYVRRLGGDEAVERVLARSGVQRTVAELEDEAGWSTYEDKIALWQAAAVELGDPIVSRHMGETILETRVGTPLRLLLRGFGSPGMVLSKVAKVCPKFSTVATMQAIEHSRRHIVVSYELDSGKPPHRLDCESTIGLLSAAGPLFGLPLLDVEHVECQVQGAPKCIYVVRWPIRHRLRLFGRKRAHLEERVESLSAQVESLQSIAADLVSSHDTTEVLDRIVTRAARAVSAQRYVLAVRTRDGGPIAVHYDGFVEAEAEAVGAALLAEDVADDDESRIVIDVASARRHYGRLAAFYDGQWFFREERQVLAAYARSAAAALDAATALESVREREETATALLELARSLASISEPDQVAQQVADAMVPVLGASRAVVGVYDAPTNAILVKGSHGLDDWQRELLSVIPLGQHRDDALTEWLDAPEPLFTERGNERAAIGRAMLEALDVDAMATVAVRRHGEMLGIASVFFDDVNTIGPEREMLLERMSAVADQAATALENARLLGRAQHQATHDELTSLPNRVLFERAVDRALESASDDAPVGLLFVDLDGFKAVNDRFGHDAGDALLVEAARRMSASLRAGDVIARLGGDEFTVLLPGASVEVAKDIARRLADALHEPIALPHGHVTISACIGIAVAPDDAAEFKPLLRAADGAMYDAKRLGTGRCVRYDAA